MKALCSERYEDWNSRFGALGLKCLELTGDSLMYDYSELQDVHIILTTPVSSCLFLSFQAFLPSFLLLSVTLCLVWFAFTAIISVGEGAEF